MLLRGGGGREQSERNDNRNAAKIGHVRHPWGYAMGPVFVSWLMIVRRKCRKDGRFH